jgi:hypothetical protein
MMTSHPKRMRRRCPSAIKDKTAADRIVNGFMSPAPTLEKNAVEIHLTFSKTQNPAPLRNGVSIINL